MKHAVALSLASIGLLCCTQGAAAFLLRSSQPRLAALPVPADTSIRRCSPSSGPVSPVCAQIKGMG